MLRHSVRLQTNLRNFGLQVITSDGSLGSPGPPLLTATTRNSYSWPSVKFGTEALVLFPFTVAAFSQGLNENKIIFEQSRVKQNVITLVIIHIYVYTRIFLSFRRRTK